MLAHMILLTSKGGVDKLPLPPMANIGNDIIAGS